MKRLLPDRYASDTPALASSLLLRWLTLCVLVCLAGAAGFYVLAEFSSDTSGHRREMNAAAYRAQLYFDQREALLNYLVDSVVNGGPQDRDTQHADAVDGDVRRLDLGVGGDDQRLSLLMSDRAARTLAGYGTELIYISADPRTPSRWLYRTGNSADALPAELTAGRLRAHAAASASTELSQVFWMASDAAPSRVFLYRAAEDQDAPVHWLVLSLDASALASMANSKGIGDFMLIDAAGRQAVANRHRSHLPAGWLDAHPDDTFASVWANGLPRGLAFVKGVGDDGWRLVYHVPMRVLLNDNASNFASALLLCLAAMAALLMLTRRIDLQLIQPARQQHQLLLDSVAFAAAVIDMAPVGICVLRCADGEVMLDNQLARDWLGEDTRAGDWVGSWRRKATVAVSGSSRRNGEFTSSGGRQLQVLYTATRYLDADVLLCVFSDISQHRQIQAALIAAKQAADQASQAKSTFVATMSHEIRTPLYGVLGTLDLLGQTAMDARQARYFRTIQQSSSVLLKLISDILDVSKIEAGRLNLSVAPFSPQALAESVVRGYSASAMAKRLQILVATDPGLPRALVGDADRIRQVLGNLLNNAIKFTDSGRVLLRVRCETLDSGMATVSWQVTDTGMGISAADQALLFEPFHQADGSAATQGTGLGLSISDHLVKLMDGTLEVTSEKGLGSSFTMTLPLPVVVADDPPDAIVLSPCPPVHVRAPLPELAENACRWLRHWGATASCYVEGTGAGTTGAILVDTDASQGLVQNWLGPRVVASGDAGEISPDHTGDSNVLSVSMYSIEAVGRAVAQLQQGRASPAAPKRRTRMPALDLDILVAEDNAINRVILKEQLEALGCRVTTANDGLQAFALAKHRTFDVLVTDINMPGMDGTALVANLRQRASSLYIIGATANATRQERERCLQTGMDGYLVKPVTTAALREALAPLTERKRAC